MPTREVSENFLSEFAISRKELTMFMYDVLEKVQVTQEENFGNW